MKIGKMKLGSLLSGVTVASLLFCLLASAADKVVVIPLLSSGSGDEIPTVRSAGQVWMDRNLGAIRVAGSTSDSLAYGWLYQWGRSADGHESRSSPTTATLSDTPNHGSFITVSASPYDWRSTQDDTLWAGEVSPNNPCPAGFRLPTEDEWNTERASWGSNSNATGAYASPLKLVVAGARGGSSISGAGSYGAYWSSTVDGSDSRGLYFDSGIAGMYSIRRAYGRSVRCIKD